MYCTYEIEKVSLLFCACERLKKKSKIAKLLQNVL